MRTFIENYLHFMKNCIRPHYEKLKPFKSGFIENSIFENNRDPCFCPQLTEELEILWRVGRKAEIQQVSEEREPGFLAQGFLSTKLLYLERLACEGLGGEIF